MASGQRAGIIGASSHAVASNSLGARLGPFQVVRQDKRSKRSKGGSPFGFGPNPLSLSIHALSQPKLCIHSANLCASPALPCRALHVSFPSFLPQRSHSIESHSLPIEKSLLAFVPRQLQTHSFIPSLPSFVYHNHVHCSTVDSSYFSIAHLGSLL